MSHARLETPTGIEKEILKTKEKCEEISEGDKKIGQYANWDETPLPPFQLELKGAGFDSPLETTSYTRGKPRFVTAVVVLGRRF